MKKFIQFVEVIIISVALFLLLPEISGWVSNGNFNISMKELREAVFLGIFTPVVIYFSRRIKNEAVFVLFVVLIIVLILALIPHLNFNFH